MKRLSRYIAAWLLTRHHLALDTVKVTEERDTAIHTAERAVAAAHRFQTELAAEKAKSASLAADLDDLMGVEGIAW